MFAELDSNVHQSSTIYFQINVDEISPYTSSTKQLWPILCKIFANPDIFILFFS